MPRLFEESSAPVPDPGRGCFDLVMFAMIAIFASILYAKGCP